MKTLRLFPYSALGLMVCLSSFHLQAAWLKEHKADSFKEAIEEANTQIDFRLRYEDVDSQNQGAQALTLRTRLAFETVPYELFHAYLEFADVRAIPSDANYNSGANGELDDLLIEDPEGTELSQAWLAYDIANTLFKLGRQEINLNNQRFLGADDWRQNSQTFSAISIQNESLNYTRFLFAHINKVQTNQDTSLDLAHQDLNAKVFNLHYRGFWLSDLSLFAVWITDHPEQRQWETATYGVYMNGKMGGDFSIDYQFSLARQEDAGANPANYSTGYLLFDVDFNYQGMQASLGYERLGASKKGFLVTPLGSLHEFQGASDIFASNELGNIETGVQDTYLGLGYAHSISFAGAELPVNYGLVYHDYRADRVINQISHLGEEWQLRIAAEYQAHQMAIQLSDYHADHFANDKRHVWLSYQLSF